MIQADDLSIRLEKTHSMTGNSLFPAGKAEMLFRRRLEIDLIRVRAKNVCKILFHLRKKRSKLRFLRQDRHIQIAEPIPSLRNKLPDPAEQEHAGDSEIGRIGVGEMLTDIAERRSAEEGVHNGVKQNIRVGMAVQAQSVRNPHAAEDQIPTFREAMHIIAVSDPHCFVLAFSRASAATRSSGVVTLRFSSLPGVMITCIP